jgi:translation initiation factor IF-2
MAIKVKKIADELGVSSEEVLEQLHKLYVDAEGPDSEVSDKIAGLMRLKLGKAKPAGPPKKKIVKAKAAPPAEKKAETETKKKKTKKIAEKGEPEIPVKEKAPAEAKPEKEPEEKKEQKPAELGGIRIIKKAEPEKEGKKPDAEKPAVEEKKGINIVKRSEPAAGPAPRREKVEKLDPAALLAEVREKRFRPGEGEKIPRMPKIRPKMKIKIRKKKVGAAPASETRPAPAKIGERRTPQKVQLQVPINIRNLAPKINKKPNEIIQYIMGKGALASINQDLDEDTVRDIMVHFGYELELHATAESMEKELVAEHREEEGAAVEKRAPVVTFMGHVDHGKTSLLDYIRKTMVTKGEKGGITQHIGAYKVDTDHGSVTFLDTPGHAAFTAMRARGAHATDVVVLVVAADDGVMPQTKEAIDHARAADVPIVVAINKCDLPDANPDKVKRGLQVEDLTTENWGGKTTMVEVSAKTGEGVDTLLELLMLESELLELKANTKLRARGTVIESKKTPGQGVVATLLVQNGTLRPGDIVLCGDNYGKVKAMINDRGERVNEALPSTPVEVLGLQGVPAAGDEFFVVKDEKKAKTLCSLKQSETRKEKMAESKRITLEDFHSYVVEGTVKELKIVLKADVQGSAEALKQSFEELKTEEVKTSIIHSAAGNINESDIMLAMVSNGVIIGFSVKVDPQAEELAKAEKVDIHLYDIIYEAIADIKASLEGLLEPEEKEVFQGRAEVREVFVTSKAGKVAGCSVIKGVIHRKDRVKLKRGGEVVFDGEINDLKRFKDDVKDVKEGFECGISIRGFNDIRKNDIIEAYIIEKVARRLEK